MTFDLIFMTVQAAIDGVGVADGPHRLMCEEDIAKGRLVVPFKIALPADAGSLSGLARRAGPIRRNSSAFRQWLLASVQSKP